MDGEILGFIIPATTVPVSYHPLQNTSIKMVHLKIIKEGSIEEDAESHLIKLEKSQASKVPFPPGCPVLVLDKTNILYSGEVAAVYVSFDHYSGACHNCYRIISQDARGTANSAVVDGAKLRYAINCPIKISSRADKVIDDECIEGVIKGFEIQEEDDGNEDSPPSFLYSVEVSAVETNSQERIFRQRGISPEHIRFRETPTTSSHQADFETSVVSLDDASSGGKDRPRAPEFCSPIKMPPTPTAHLTGTFSPPASTPQGSDHRASFTDAGSPPLIHEVESKIESKIVRKCLPLAQPIPTHFQGDLDTNARVPDFSFLTNYPGHKMAHMPDGTKRCVMCGDIRSCNAGKSNKTKSMKGTTQFALDAIVIPNQNKGICTACDVNIWVLKDSGLQIKWCKGCKVRIYNRDFSFTLSF